jgi:hypothetical protein
MGRSVRYRLFIAACVGAVAVSIAAWRSHAIGRRQQDERAWMQTETVRLAARAKSAFGSLRLVPVSSVASPDDWESLLSQAELSGEPALPAGSTMEGLRREAAEFLYFRLGQDSAEAYMDWRERSGYVVQSMDDMRRVYMVHAVYAPMLGGDVPSDMDSRTLFERLWPVMRERLDRSSVPAEVASEPGGVGVAVAKLTAQARDWPRLGGSLGVEGWYGSGRRNASMTPFYRPARSERSLLENFGEAWCAVVGVIMQFERGDRRPILLGLLWDPVDARWRVWRLWTYNFDRPASEIIF